MGRSLWLFLAVLAAGLAAVPAALSKETFQPKQAYVSLYEASLDAEGFDPGRNIVARGLPDGSAPSRQDLVESNWVMWQALYPETPEPKVATAPTGAAPSAGGSPAASGGYSAPASGHLASIAQCESGGNPAAVSADGQYRGLYQFSYSTWASVGGTGDPAAASPAEQHQRAAMLYAQAGSSPWPTCG